MAGCRQASSWAVAESSTYWSVGVRQTEILGQAWAFETSKLTPTDTPPPASHTEPNKATFPNTFQIVSLTGDQTFKDMCIWEELSFKAAHRCCDLSLCNINNQNSCIDAWNQVDKQIIITFTLTIRWRKAIIVSFFLRN